MSPDQQTVLGSSQPAESSKPRTGLVTLLFTDMVGSTALKQQLGDLAGDALFNKHHQLVRDTLSSFPTGQEIETAGDSFLIVFSAPSDAVRFGLLLQVRLRQLRGQSKVALSDRMGIHLGEVVLRSEGPSLKPRELYGIQIDICARVMSLAKGGQVLMSRGVFDSARQVLKGEDIEGVGQLEWLNHGPYLLKGLDEPVEICEVREAGKEVQGPPTSSEKAQRQVRADEEPVLGWRPAVGQPVPNTRWVLEKKLGEGGFGEVWLGRNTTTKQASVFKFCFQAERVRFLKRELTLFRLLKERVGDHPNIVAIRDVYLDQPPFYVEMEYVEGKDLRSWSQDHGGLAGIPVETRLEIVAQAADALQAAHDAGIIHRDVKPANILIGGKGIGPTEVRVKITDFGIGQVVSEKYLKGITRAGFTQTMVGSSSSSHTGTQLYMAPELLAGKPASTRSDIYSLGVVLYQLLVGDFTRPVATDWAKDLGDPLLRQDLQHCFAGKPEERFAGAAQLAKNLRSLERRRATLAEQQAALAAAERAAYRRGVVRTASIAVVIVGLMLGLLIFGVNQTRRAARQQRRAEASELGARQTAYAAQMKLAHAAFKAGKIGSALELLKAQRPPPGRADFRGFEWRYLYGLCLSSPSEVVATNASGFQSVDYSPTGRTVALGTDDGYVELFDAQTRQLTKRWQAHAGAINCLAFYPRNSNWLATVGRDEGILKLWDIARARALLSTRTAQGMMVDFAFSPGGRFLATRAPDAPSVDLWEFHAGAPGGIPTLTLRTNFGFLGPAAFSPAEQTMAVCNQMKGAELPNLLLYDLASGFLTHLPAVHSDFIMSAAFSPDGSTLATGGADERVVLWDLKTQKTLWTNRSDFIAVTSVAFTPDGRTLFTSGYDQNICSWKVGDPTQVQAWLGHSGGVNRLAIAPNGRSFASASDDGTARLWTLPTAEFASALPLQEEFTTLFPPKGLLVPEHEPLVVFGVAVSPAQDRAVATENRRLLLCDLATGTVLTNVGVTNIFKGGKPQFGGLTFSPDGRELAVGSDDGRVAFLDPVALQPLRAPLKLYDSQITHLAYALSGTTLVTGGGFGAGIKLTDVASGRMITTFPGTVTLPLQPLAVSRDGQRLATGSPEGRVCIWDIAGHRIVASTQPVRFLISVAFSPEGSLLAFGDHRGAIFLWDLSGQRPLRKLAGHAGEANTLAFSPDGHTLASGGMDHMVRLWRPDIDQEVAILTGHTEWVWCVAFAKHGNALLSGSRDGTLKLWRALSFEEIEAAERAKGGRP